MTATTLDVPITEPGVYPDLAEDTYHAHPALSSTGARKLMPPSCPALFKHERDNGRPPKRSFDLGHAGHLYVLGRGARIVTVDADDWRTKDARQARDEARAVGAVPLLAHEDAEARVMAAALKEHPLAAALLAAGEPEQSLFWTDEQTGVPCRARLDLLPEARRGSRFIVTDYKTCASAERDAVRRSMASYGYHQQAAWYLEAVRALGLHDRPAFVFIFQERAAPYLVNVVELTADALALGAALNHEARQTFAECTANDHWPGYSERVELIDLPPWSYYVNPEEIR